MKLNFTFLRSCFLLILISLFSSVTHAQLSILVEQVPDNTPHDATLYLVGSFNNWNPADPQYRFVKLEDGTYKIVLQNPPDRFDYKITRGNWSSVEGRENGRAMLNRRFQLSDNQENIIRVKIKTWEDLAGERISVYILILLLAAFQGFILVTALQGLQDHNRSANLMLSLVILLTSVALLGRVGVQYRGLFQEYPKIILIPDYLLFLYAPLFLFYIQKLLTIQAKNYSKRWYHFIPFFVQFLAYLPLLLAEKQNFIDNIVDRTYVPMFATTGFLALVYNSFYWFKCHQVLKNFRTETPHLHSFSQNTNFLYSVLVMQAVCLGSWLGMFVLASADHFLSADLLSTVEFCIDSIWVVLSVITYFLGYVAMQQPEIFKMNTQESLLLNTDKVRDELIIADLVEEIAHQPVQLQPTTEPSVTNKTEEAVEEKRYKESTIPKEQLETVRRKLPQLMEKQKPFYNPKLTLAELAHLLDATPHALSRVINETYDKNFQDFVNDYRIEEFKILALRKDKQHYTLLAIALEVGFNSKTAFNRAFKKATGITPSEYVRNQGRENDGSV